MPCPALLEWSRSLTMITVFVGTVSLLCITICPERTLHNHRDTRSSSFALPSTTTTIPQYCIQNSFHSETSEGKNRESQTEWNETGRDGWNGAVDDQQLMT